MNWKGIKIGWYLRNIQDIDECIEIAEKGDVWAWLNALCFFRNPKTWLITLKKEKQKQLDLIKQLKVKEAVR